MRSSTRGSWFGADCFQARMKRIVAALVPEEQSESFRQPSTSLQRRRTFALAIHARRSELISMWRHMP
jgi:hypothetical protein